MSFLERCPLFRGKNVWSSLTWDLVDVSFLERCPHLSGILYERFHCIVIMGTILLLFYFHVVGCITHFILVVRRTNEDWATTRDTIRFEVTVGSDSKNIQFGNNFGTHRIRIENITIDTFEFENSCIRATDIDGLALTKNRGSNGWNVDTVFVMAGVNGCYEKYVVLSATHGMRRGINSDNPRYDLRLLPQF